MKKCLSFLLVAAMALSMVSVSALADEPVKIDMFYQSSRPMNEFTEMTRQKVIEDIGVDMNLIQGGDNWKQQLALYITGGNVPDLVAFMDANTFQGYAAEGAFYDLTDLIGNYPHIMEYLSTVYGYTAEDMLKRTSIDGRIYGIPSVTIARSYYTENIRTDWLEKLGLEMPVTLDDWTNVMRAFTNDDPDGDQQKNTYGFSGSRTYNSLTPFFGAFGARPDQCYFLGEDGKVITNVLSEDYKAALTYLRDIYAEGLIDPEMFTANDQQTYEKWVRGEFGVWNSWFGANIYQTKTELHPLQMYLQRVLMSQSVDLNKLKTKEEIEQAREVALGAQQLKYALIVFITLPILFIYPMFQKQFMKGIMLGSLKG